MKMSPIQQAIILLAQNYFINTDRSGECILVITDDILQIRNLLNGIAELKKFRVSSYVNDKKQNVVIVSFNF